MGQRGSSSEMANVHAAGCSAVKLEHVELEQLLQRDLRVEHSYCTMWTTRYRRVCVED